jgi:hypothetical protein
MSTLTGGNLYDQKAKCQIVDNLSLGMPGDGIKYAYIYRIVKGVSVDCN